MRDRPSRATCHVLGLMLLCALPGLEARATAFEGGASLASVAGSSDDANHLAARTEADGSGKTRRATDIQSTQAGSGKDTVSKQHNALTPPRRATVTPRRPVTQPARSHSASKHAALSGKSHATPTPRPRGPGAPMRAAIGATDNRGSRGASLTRQSMASDAVARGPTSPRMIGSDSTLRARPRASGPTSLGGPAVGRAATSGTINGARLHRKF